MKRCETVQSFVRFLGCFIFIIDICCKIQYYLTVRFVSLQLKQVYKTFLFVRPIAILCILFYNFVIGSIQVFKIIQRHINSVKYSDPKSEKREEELKEGGEQNTTNNFLQEEESQKNINALQQNEEFLKRASTFKTNYDEGDLKNSVKIEELKM